MYALIRLCPYKFMPIQDNALMSTSVRENYVACIGYNIEPSIQRTEL